MLWLLLLTISMALIAGAQGLLRFELKRFEKKTTRCVMTFEYPK
jgi:hypothetical protein